MSQLPTDLELDDILSEAGQTPEKSPTPWSSLEDEQLLKDLYALMGDIPKEPEAPAPAAEIKPEPQAQPEKKPAEVSAQPTGQKPEDQVHTQEADVHAAPVPTAQRLPEQEPVSQSSAPVQEDWDELPSQGGAPGWLKGTFLFLISLLLCGMTLYAVAADVLGPLF